MSTPGSSSYRHYLTRAQWESRYSPASAEVSAAQKWLRSEGFTLGKVSKDRITVGASGTAAQVESAFGTGLENYRVAGHTERMATSNLSVPSSIAGDVAGAIGINQHFATPDLDSGGPATSAPASSPSASSGDYPPPPAATVLPPPCGTYFGQKTTTPSPPVGHGLATTLPDVVCGYKPSQMRTAYGLTSSQIPTGVPTGKGQTVAIIDAYDSATIGQDATQYFQNNDPNHPFSTADFTQADAMPFDDEAECDASGWLTEQALDVDSVHSMAPNAHILYVGAQDCVNGLFDAEQAVIDNGAANVVTNSWGDTGGDLYDDSSTKTAWDDEFELADTTGTSILFSSGDSGDNFSIFGASVADYPASSPFVTAVGGTTLELGSGGTRTAEYEWEPTDSFLCTSNLVGKEAGCTASKLNTWLAPFYDGGGGGFTSQYYTQPWYQQGVVPDSLSERNTAFGPVPLRVEPDFSMDAASSTGFLIGLTETFPDGSVKYAQPRFGGTSLASPLLAGLLADANQIAGQPLGFVNPDLYELDKAHPSAIHDVGGAGKNALYRVDEASLFIPGTSGTIQEVRETDPIAPEVYCDTTNNCATRPVTLTAAKGFDSATGLGTPGGNFLRNLAAF